MDALLRNCVTRTAEEQLRNSECKFKVCPSWGVLTTDSIKQMDGNLKKTLYFTVLSIADYVNKHGENSLSWDSLLSIMNQNNAIRKRANSEIEKYDKKTRDDTNVFKTSGAPDGSQVDMVRDWLRNFIGNPDLVSEVGINNLKTVGEVYASNGARVDSFTHFFANVDETHQTITDIGILRYPDITKPYVELHRLWIAVDRKDTRTLFVEDDESTIQARLNSVQYELDEAVLNAMEPAIVEQAGRDADKMLLELL